MRKRVLKIAGALCLGLLIAEFAFYIRDAGAFPHVNIYEADTQLAARLKSNASQKISFGGNPVSTFTTNALGYRGEDWGEERTNEILVVGDSQVFGLGVNDDETFSATLAKASGQKVLNAGVPTYGPDEYLKVAEALLKTRKPKHVVFTVNMVNDFFENDNPNLQRHKIWDGWAVRSETAPESVTWFPFRETLMSKSHLVYAARRFWHELKDPSLEFRTLPSEGRHSPTMPKVRVPKEAAGVVYDENTKALRVKEYTPDTTQHGRFSHGRYDLDGVVHAQLAGNPGDIVGHRERRPFAEESGPISGVVSSLRARRTPLAPGDLLVTTETKRLALRKFRKQMKDIEYSEGPKQASLLRKKIPPNVTIARPQSELHHVFEKLATLAKTHNAEVTLLVLPLDLTVHENELRKYGESGAFAPDALTPYVDELRESAKVLGMRFVDAKPALTKASPGAFLDADIHLSAKGHSVVAAALNAALLEPRPYARATYGQPAGRSRVPHLFEWETRDEITVKGSSALRCETIQIDEWVRVWCYRRYKYAPPIAIKVISAPNEVMPSLTPDSATLLASVQSGEQLQAAFVWKHTKQRLTLSADHEGQISGMFEADDSLEIENENENEKNRVDEICRAHRKIKREVVCKLKGGQAQAESCKPACLSLYGNLDERCDALGENKRYACHQGNLDARIDCDKDETQLLTTGQCAKLCHHDSQCRGGRCREWMGTQACIGVKAN